MREAQNLSLRDLAEMSGTSYAYLSLVERGARTPTDRWLRAVTDALANHMLGAAS
jgi:transcriptional regulator with XRE-family HTH domain